MSQAMLFRCGTATETDIIVHLQACDTDFVPPLSARTDIIAYARKIAAHALCFEAWSGSELVGLVASYCNDPALQVAYITNVSVLPSWRQRGIATTLLAMCLRDARCQGFARAALEVGTVNSAARAFYARMGFVAGDTRGAIITQYHDLRTSLPHA